MRAHYIVKINGSIHRKFRLKSDAQAYAQSMKQCHPEWQVYIIYKGKLLC